MAAAARFIGSSQKRQRGLTLVEYVAAGGVVAVVTVAAFFALGGVVATQIDRVAVAIETDGAGAPP
jgi:Flp pilus assembly pilin Flp